jgi:hypothetical protein
MKILIVAAELFRADGQTDMKLVVAFCILRTGSLKGVWVTPLNT